MNNELRPYEEYTKVDLLWLDKIPKHWNIKRAKSMFNVIDIRSDTGTEELLSVSANYGVIKRKNVNVTMFKAESYKGYKLCWKEDLAVNSLWAWQQGLGFSEYHGIISNAYSVYRLNNKNLFNYKYYDYLIRSSDYLWELRVRSKGIWRSRYQLTDQSFMDMPIIIPSKNEQDQIVKYLDFKLAKINKFIKSKKKLIEALKEQIECYVFGNQDKTLVDEIKSWDTAFSKEWLFIKASRLTKEISIKNNVGSELLAVTQDRGVVYKRDCEQNYVSPGSDLSALKLVRNGDFVISLRSFQGGIEFSEIEGIVSPAYNVFCLRKEYSSYEYKMYYKYLFKTKIFISVLNTLVSGIRDGKNINYSDFAKILLPIPPEKTVIKICKLIEKYERIKNQFKNERILLEEFKNSLISDVVTGKVDVRHIPIDEIIEEDTEIDETEDEIMESEEDINIGESEE